MCPCPRFLLVFIGVRRSCLELNEHGFSSLSVLTRHTKTDTSLTTKEMFEHVVHALIPDSGAVLSERHLFNKGGSLQDHKILGAAVTAYCYGEPWCDVLAGAGTCSSSVRKQAAVHFELASCLLKVTPEQQEEAETLILADPACALMVKGLEVGHTAAMASLGKKVSKGPGEASGFRKAVVWRLKGGVWSGPCESCFAAAMEMGLCELADGCDCTAVKVVGALRRKVEYPGQLYKDVAAKFEVKKVSTRRRPSRCPARLAATPRRRRVDGAVRGPRPRRPRRSGRRISTAAATRRPRISPPVS